MSKQFECINATYRSAQVPSNKSQLRFLLELVAYPGEYSGRPSPEDIRCMARAELLRIVQTPVAWCAGVPWEHKRQSELMLTVSQHSRPAQGFTVPLYAGEPAIREDEKDVPPPIAWCTGIYWEEASQSERILKVTRVRQPQYEFVIPLYAEPSVTGNEERSAFEQYIATSGEKYSPQCIQRLWEGWQARAALR